MARVYRFIAHSLSQKELDNSDLEIREKEEPEIIFQLARVLRGKTGDQIILQANTDKTPVTEFKYEVIEIKKNAIALKLLEKKNNENETGFSINLWLCLPNKPEKLEMIIQKAVELGASEVVLLEGERSQFKHGLRSDRLEKIIWEAAEQSERAMVPGLSEKGKLANHLESLDNDLAQKTFVAMERLEKTEQNLLERFADAKKRFGIINILVGPEGGFSDEEKMLIEKAGINTFSLGKRILRMETAAILSVGIAALA